MTEEKKRKKPIGAMVWALVGIAAGVRALYRPHRAIMKDGFPTQCAAVNCDPSMVVTSYAGQSEFFAPARGTIVEATPTSVYLVLADEATLLEYTGTQNSLLVQVSPGQRVGAGQQLGLAAALRFAVYEIARTPNGQPAIGNPVEPAAWLATHGARISATYHKTTAEQWCAGGRKLVVPQAVANCKIKLPAPGGFSLLPISATME